MYSDYFHGFLCSEEQNEAVSHIKLGQARTQCNGFPTNQLFNCFKSRVMYSAKYYGVRGGVDMTAGEKLKN